MAQRHNEIWKDIIGYEGLYLVSDYGKIKSLPRPTTKGGFIRQMKQNNGHLVISLSRDGKKKWYRIHRLMMQAFVGPCPVNMECCHNDGDVNNNNMSNLRYDTHKNNMRDCSKHGGFPDRRGINNVRARLTPGQVISIRKLYDHNALLTNRDKLSQLQIANIFDISEYAVWAIINRKTWRHVNG